VLSSYRDFFGIAGFATVTRENACISLFAGSKKFSLARIFSSCHTELSPRPRDFRFETSDEISISNHVSSLRVSPKRGLQRRHLVLQRVSDARARPGLPYLFRSSRLAPLTASGFLVPNVRRDDPCAGVPAAHATFFNSENFFRKLSSFLPRVFSFRDFSRNDSRARSKRATPSAASSAGLLAKPSRRFFIPFLFGLLARESGDVEQLQARRPVR